MEPNDREELTLVRKTLWTVSSPCLPTVNSNSRNNQSALSIYKIRPLAEFIGNRKLIIFDESAAYSLPIDLTLKSAQ